MDITRAQQKDLDDDLVASSNPSLNHGDQFVLSSISVLSGKLTKAYGILRLSPDPESSLKKKSAQASEGKRLKTSAKGSNVIYSNDILKIRKFLEVSDERTNAMKLMNNDDDEFVHPKLSTFDEKERQDEEDKEEEWSDDEAYDEETQGVNVEGEELDEEETNKEEEANKLYRDMNVNLEERDTEMTIKMRYMQMRTVMMMERFIQPIDDPLALVSNASNQKYPTQSSESQQSSNAEPSIDVRGRYNANNQGRPFQRNNARGNVVVGNVGGQNRVGNMNPASLSQLIQRQDALLESHENGAILDEEQLLFLAGEHVTNFDDDVDDLALNVDHVQDHDTFVDHMDEYHEVHEMQSDVHHNYVVDTDAGGVPKNERLRAEMEKVKYHYKEMFESIKITCTSTNEHTSSLLTQIEDLKAQLEGNLKVATRSSVKTKVLASLGRTGHLLVLGLRLFKTYDGIVKAQNYCGKVHRNYVSQPKGFEDQENPTHVYCLKKALYGLKQAPRAWYDTLSKFLLANNFFKGAVDPTLFTRKSGKHILLVQIYVDDIIFASTDHNAYADHAGVKDSRRVAGKCSASGIDCAIALSCNNVQHSRSKHIDIRHISFESKWKMEWLNSTSWKQTINWQISSQKLYKECFRISTPTTWDEEFNP
ncbi:retrovirus-related pol polyprotein from transposon TNT 1-94 [Tanacetum coccineum]